MTAGGSYQITNSLGQRIMNGTIPKENLSAYKQFEKGSLYSDNPDSYDGDANEGLDTSDPYWESLR